MLTSVAWKPAKFATDSSSGRQGSPSALPLSLPGPAPLTAPNAPAWPLIPELPPPELPAVDPSLPTSFSPPEHATIGRMAKTAAVPHVFLNQTMNASRRTYRHQDQWRHARGFITRISARV